MRFDAAVTPERVRSYGMLFVAVTLLTLLATALTSHGNLDAMNRPLGTDFAGVWSAGTLAHQGRAEDAFAILPHAAAQRAIFGQDTPIFGWHYPPVFLPVAELLSQLPYRAALVLYQSLTLLCYLAAMRHILRHDLPSRLWLWPVLGFPAVWVNLMHGHNGFLSAALFGGGLALLSSRPFLAGLLLGALCYKPQFGVLIPLALIAGAQWRAFAGATLAVCILVGFSLLCYGGEPWQAFLTYTAFTRVEVLEAGSTGFHKIQTVFAAARMWGASIALAYGAQAAVALFVAVSVARVWRSKAAVSYKAALLLIGSLLATPYALDYDLMLLAPAIAFLAVQWQREPLPLPGLAALLALGWAMPFFARMSAQYAGVPLGVAVLFALFVFTARAARIGAALSTSQLRA